MTFDSARYWSERYALGGTSGAGSYGNLAAYKACFLNEFVKLNEVESVVELGCGDGHQLSLAEYPRYVGFDVSVEALELCRARFAHDATKQFFSTDAITTESHAADLAISLDVLYHLVEDDVYHRYMKNLFALGKKFVIIYALHADFSNGAHIKARPFLQDVDFNVWQLVNRLKNPRPWDANRQQTTSFAHFYIFAKKDSGAVIPMRGEKGLYLLGNDDIDGFRTIRDALMTDSLRHAAPLELVARYAESLPPPALLDLGCGAGDSLRKLEDRNLHVRWTGCDIQNSDEVRSRLITDQTFVTFDGEHLPFADGAFDIVLSRQVFEHVEHPRSLLHEVARVLKQGGYFIGSVSQLESYHARSFYNFTTYGFARLARDAGLTVERFALGADAMTLLQRRIDGRGAGYAALLDPRRSAVYAAIEHADQECGEDARITLYKQLLCAGRFSFVLSKGRTSKRTFDHLFQYAKILQNGDALSLYIDADTFNASYDEDVATLRPLRARRSPPLLVSLTSYPQRLSRLHIAVYSLLRQSLSPDMIILWLARDEFPHGEADLPARLLRLKDYGLDIRFCENLRSYKKILPALRAYPEAVIVTADDDAYYPENWLRLLYQAHEQDPTRIHAYRAHQVTLLENARPAPYMQWKHCLSADHGSSFRHLFTGVGGVLYPPGALHPDVLNAESAAALAPTADDLWLWSMAVLGGTRINIVPSPTPYMITTYPERDFRHAEEGQCLYAINGPGGANDVQLARLMDAYPLLVRRVADEPDSQ